MKKILLLSLTVFFILPLGAQNVSINTTGSPADPSAILDVTSTDKGILIPRMSGFQRFMIINPAQGLLVFDTDSRSFWFYSNGWNEIASGGGNNGPASGDLSGNYPSPNVAKIQNLDVAFGVPFDKQVLKWDALSNNWKGRNDSLFLPYNVAYGSATKLFGITNNNTTGGSSAVFGRSGNTQSGINPGFTMGVWGDNATGQGVAGTSSAGNGVFGSSIYNHGVVGYSGNPEFAGIYGSHGEVDGIGVMGEVEEPGTAIYGRATGPGGQAAKIEMTHTVNPNSALSVLHEGVGRGIEVNLPNQENWSDGVNVAVGGTGYGIRAASNYGGAAKFEINNASNANGHALDVYTEGLGSAATIQSINPAATNLMIAGSNYGLGSGLYLGMYNNNNNGNGLEIVQNGIGTTGYFYKNNTSGSISDIHKPAVWIQNNSKGSALKVVSLHSPSVNAAIDVQYGGDAFGVNINSTKLGLHAFTTDANGVSVLGENFQGGYAVKGLNNASSKGAVYGENNQMFGIGVEAVATGSQAHAIKGTANTATDAILGVNNGDSGSAVCGRTNAPSVGIGILGETSLTSWGIPGHFISYCPDAHTNTLWLRDFSKGQTMRIQVDNELNDSEAFYVVHHGIGKLASLHNDVNEMFSVENNGNTMTKGTVTVKGNKGIVRNSTSTQMRMEMPSVQLIYFGMPVGASTTISVNFGTAFSSVPVVSLGNIQSGHTGPCDKMTVQIKNVTTTGCSVTMYNPGVGGNPDVSGTWNLVAIGAE